MSTSVILNAKQGRRNGVHGLTGAVLSYNGQLQSFPRFIESSRSILDEIRKDFDLSRFHPEYSIFLQRAAKRLAGFCADADGWGFDSLYRVGFGLQTLLVKSFTRAKDDCFWETLNQGLELLFSLLSRCEKDYHQRAIVADILESFERIACH